MKYFFTIVLLVMAITCMAQNNGVSISGKVILQYPVNVKILKRTVMGQEGIKDFKVVLLRVNAIANDQQFIASNKQKICSNDASILRTYSGQVTYTDGSGNYTFSNLQRDATYILVYCSKNITITMTSTDRRSGVNYKMSDKIITQ